MDDLALHEDATLAGVSDEKGAESLFAIGEVGSGVSLDFDDYLLVRFVVLR